MTATKTIEIQKPLDRKDQLLFACNTDGIGLEIGASYNPVVTKKGGYNIEILDHASGEDLRKKYENTPNVNIANIEEVDYIWSGKPLDETTQKSDYYDYIIASHVIEHTPDMISFLNQCETMLKPGGVLALAVPDKRYCFDYFRPLSTTGDVLQAFHEKRTRHTPGTIFDFASSMTDRNGLPSWQKTQQGDFKLRFGLDYASALMQQSMKQDVYMDAHNWRFTTNSFRLILGDLTELSYTGLAECSYFDSTGCEFLIGLRKGGEPVPVNRLELLKAIANGE